MQLWNDYEGKLLAGTFPIGSLLSTEGRNASFATRHRDGRPAVLRLTEALNDQQEMRARFQAIQRVEQRNLVAIESYGDVEMEGTPLIYLVMEATEENLGEILRERTLTVEETGEVATSLVAALEALHAGGLVHGDLQPSSVLAAGQVVKLRSDCVRPAPEGSAGDRLRSEDVLGLADVLNRCLSQRHLQDASDALALPEPYASIVRNVARGSWGLEQVASELRRSVRPAAAGSRPVQAEAVQAAPVLPAPAQRESLPSHPAQQIGVPAAQVPPVAGRSVPVRSVPDRMVPDRMAPDRMVPDRPDASLSAALPVQAPVVPSGREAAPAAFGSLATAGGSSENGRGLTSPVVTRAKSGRDGGSGDDLQLPLVYAAPEGEPKAAGALSGRWRKPAEDGEGSFAPWIAGAAAVLLLVWLLWHFAGGSKAQGGAAVSPAAQLPRAASTTAGPQSAALPAPASRAFPVPARPQAKIAEPVAKPAELAGSHGQVWRVIAYTYNLEAQARAKAKLVELRHASLRPQVFSRTGHAPYLVALGGALTKAQAEAMLEHARSQGLARDVYMQNYSR